jgi:hypothetical protein
MHEDMIKLSGISTKVRQIAIKNIGRDEPTLLITNDLTTGRKNLFARYAERMMIENELDAYRRVPPRRPHQRRLTQCRPRHHPDRRRRPALPAPRAQAVPVRTTPATLWRDFLDATGTLHIDETGVTCALNLRATHPILIDAGFAELAIPIPWWDGRTLRFTFPPR